MNISPTVITTPNAGQVGATGAMQTPVQTANARPDSPSLTVVNNASVSLDGIGDVPEEVTRDDALGRLFAAVFDLPAPPPPNFAAALAT